MVLQALLAEAAQPQGRLGLIAMRSPGAKPATPAPTSSITPATSWPSTIGCWMRIVPKPPCW